ncbi:MAG: hypothetical protein ACTS73_06545 [Arsenophonus sp. NEOnobi-MAG3]
MLAVFLAALMIEQAPEYLGKNRNLENEVNSYCYFNNAPI